MLIAQRPGGILSFIEHEITRLLQRWAKGDAAAPDQLLPLVYKELHKLAKRYMAQQSPDHTLQTTALINEAYLKLAAGAPANWENRAHFYGVAAKAMRQVLVDYARHRQTAKRGGEINMVTLDENLAISGGIGAEMVALDEALNALVKLDPRKGQVVELRYFGGLSVDEIAGTLKVSPETVARDWQFAKTYLQREMKQG